MRHTIGALAMVAMIGCGGPVDRPDDETGAVSADAGDSDAGAPTADAGGACDDPIALGICDQAVANVATCCSNVDAYVPRSGADFCGYINLNTGAPGPACKNIADMTCTRLIAFGLCY